MGIPDKLAVHSTGSDQHRQLLDFLGEGGLVPQVVDQVVGAPAHLGAVDHYRPRTSRDHAATASGLRVEGGVQGLGHPVTGHYGCTCHVLLLSTCVVPRVCAAPGMLSIYDPSRACPSLNLSQELEDTLDILLRC